MWLGLISMWDLKKKSYLDSKHIENKVVATRVRECVNKWEMDAQGSRF